MAAAHVVLQLLDGPAFTALALMAMGGLAAVPVEAVAMNSWARIAPPLVLAVCGLAARGFTQRGLVATWLRTYS
jgi:hypothetical protein